MKTNKIKVITKTICIGIIMILSSCAQPEKSFEYNTAESISLDETGETPLLNAYEIEEKEEESDTKNVNEQSTSDLKIIRNANCRIKVSNVEAATKRAKGIASKYNGYIADERFSNTNYAKENRFTIRIPKDNFDSVLEGVSSLAEFVDHKNITTIDVTEEYIDIASRLKTRLEVKERYERILRDKAKTVEDILLAESKIKELQEEIEAAQGRLHYISNKVSYSTIQLDIYETVIPEEEPQRYVKSFIDKAEDGLSFGWNLLQHLFLVLFYIWPLLVVGILVYIYFKWIRK